MPRTAVMLAVESAVSRAPQLSSELLTNYFVERQGQGSKAQTPLFGVPGLTQFANPDLGPTRGCWLFGGVAYFVMGANLVSISQTGMWSVVGAGIQGTGPVSMSDNGVQLCMVNGAQGYIYTTGMGLVQITAAAFYPAATVRFMDGYFIFDRLGTNEFFLSALYDGTSFNGLDFASAEGQPGVLVTTFQNLQLLFLFCSGHIEIWYDSGALAFPFARYAGGIINYGTISPYSVLEQDGALFFLGVDKVFYRLQANAVIRASTHPIEHAVAEDADITKAYCATYTLEGHKMVALNLPVSGQTLELDISSQRWHNRTSTDPGSGLQGLWRANYMVEAYQRTLVGDVYAGLVGVIDWSTYTEYGAVIQGLIQSAILSKDRLRIFCYNAELDIEAGVGLTNPPGADPQVFLQVSRDGGQTWGLSQPPRTMGKIGAYLTRLRWLRQGQARQFVWRLLVVDPVQRVIIGFYVDIDVGTN